MNDAIAHRPDFSHIRPLLLAMARERSSQRVLELAVERLAQANNIVAARAWLVGPGDVCALCTQRDRCTDRTECLHLVAGTFDAAAPGFDSSAWAALSPRTPLAPEDGGEYAAGPEVAVLDLAEAIGRGRPMSWANRMGLGGACSVPLRHRDELLGCLEVYTARPVPEEGPEWLRIIADHAAAALANSRAFEEIERLRQSLARENTHLRAEIRRARAMGPIVGASVAVRELLQQVELVAPTRSTVLLLGESGTGKELLAHEIHARSERSGRPFVMVNCATIPAQLYESEFFGHRRGAFTGADSDRTGRFELADQGTLFLDEIGELPLEMQAKLLRVLQEGQYQRVGESTSQTADVRIIAATNRDLSKEVEAGRFRSDLFYRLDVFPVRVPPLRERREDVPLLARHFLALLSEQLGRPPRELDERALASLCAYDWPGNIRELRNVLERALISSRGAPLHVQLPSDRRRNAAAPPASAATPEIQTEAALRRLELDNLRRALARADGKISGPGGAAELLGLHPATLASRIRRMGVQPDASDRSD